MKQDALSTGFGVLLTVLSINMPTLIQSLFVGAIGGIGAFLTNKLMRWIWIKCFKK